MSENTELVGLRLLKMMSATTPGSDQDQSQIPTELRMPRNLGQEAGGEVGATSSNGQNKRDDVETELLHQKSTGLRFTRKNNNCSSNEINPTIHGQVNKKTTVHLDDALNADVNSKIKNLEGVSSNQELRPHNQRHTDLLGGKNVVVTSK